MRYPHAGWQAQELWPSSCSLRGPSPEPLAAPQQEDLGLGPPRHPRRRGDEGGEGEGEEGEGVGRRSRHAGAAAGRLGPGRESPCS